MSDMHLLRKLVKIKSNDKDWDAKRILVFFALKKIIIMVSFMYTIILITKLFTYNLVMGGLNFGARTYNSWNKRSRYEGNRVIY